MAEDYRVMVGFPDDDKTCRLKTKLGPSAVEYLLRLWSFTRSKRPKGVLAGVTHTRIAEIVTRRVFGATLEREEAKIIVDVLIEEGWLEKTGRGALQVHDWKEIQSFAVYAPERKKRAQTASKIRWDKERKRLALSAAHAPGMHPECAGYAPTPTPAPTPAPFPPPSDGGGNAPSAELVSEFEAVVTAAFENHIRPELDRINHHRELVPWAQAYSGMRGWIIGNPDKCAGYRGNPAAWVGFIVRRLADLANRTGAERHTA